MDKNAGIGVFDSGVGGLTVASKISQVLPNETIYYFGDTAHVPYGDKTEDQVTGYVCKIIDFLKNENIKALVMACNTSSAIVLPHLNHDEIDIPVLGVIEFASRLALRVSTGEKIGVVANPVTVRSGAYVHAITKISLNGVYVHQQACPRWVPLIEAGKTSGEEIERVVREDLEPLIKAGVDTLILGCTHYPYLTEVIQKIMPRGVRIVDPAEALARRLKSILKKSGNLSSQTSPDHRFYVSGDPDEFKKMGSVFFGKDIKTVLKVDLDGIDECRESCAGVCSLTSS
jgi:glutamate racemase